MLELKALLILKYLQACRLNKINWTDREIYLGVDLSIIAIRQTLRFMLNKWKNSYLKNEEL